MLHLLFFLSCGQNEEGNVTEIASSNQEKVIKKDDITFDLFQVQQIVWDPEAYYQNDGWGVDRKPKDASVPLEVFSTATQWYRHDNYPKLTPLSDASRDTKNTDRMTQIHFYLKKEEAHPLAFGWTPAKKEKVNDGIFTNGVAIQIFAVSSSVDQEGIAALLGDIPEENRMFPYLSGAGLKHPSSKYRDEPLERSKLPSLQNPLSLHVFCWGGV